jgi:hypothetical protein
MIIKRDDDFMSDLYWFWYKYIHYKYKSKSGLPDRFKDQFKLMLSILETKYPNMRGLKEGKYNGQSKSEFDKNYKRVKDIVDKSAGSKERAAVLAQTQANRITDEWKAINRAMAAKQVPNLDEVHEAIFESFFQRAYELGSVSKQEYREYKLEKLGI